jgi:iron complex outermembrane receptor protein
MQKVKTRKIMLGMGTALGAMLWANQGVLAQEAPVSPAAPDEAQADQEADAVGLEDIVVTGRKRARAEDIQDTPLSITAFSSAQLDRAVVEDLTDVGRMTPNASLQQSSQRGIQNFAIRGMGISGSTPSDEPAVGVFQDGVYWGANYGALGDLFDMEGVEILRGPQGTLFGRNVTGGAVTVRSARPGNEFEGNVTAGVGSHGLVEGSAVLNAPLVDDLLAVRLAVQARTFDGYFFDTNTGSDYGESTSFLVRPSIRLTPTPNFDITLLGEYYSEEGDPTVARGIAPNTIPGGPVTLPEREGYVTPSDYWSVSPNVRGSNDIQVRFAMLEANWRIGGGVLTSITGYRDVATRVVTDYDGTPSRAFAQGIRYDQNQFSSELRYAREIGDWLNFTVGAYYFDQEVGFSETRDLNNGTLRLATSSILDNSSFAVFAEADVTLTEGLTVTLGARYTDESKTASAAPFGRCSYDLSTCTFTGPREYSGDNLSPKLGVSYRWGDQLVFASVTRGYRSGGFSLRGTPLVEPYGAETVTAYEAGFKTDLLNRHLRFNASLFYNEYKDLQRTVLGVSPEAGVIQSVFNAADATIQGLELELTAILTDNLTLGAAYGFTDADYQTFLGVANPENREFVRVPRHTGTVALNYERNLDAGGRIAGRLSANYTGAYFYDDPNQQQQDAYTLVDASLAYTTPSDITFSIYGKNMTNEAYSPWGSTLGALGQNLFPGAPRTFGMRVSARF